ncbi:MAG: hypothetical protein AAF639_22860 [Chloroflexota bacterium]
MTVDVQKYRINATLTEQAYQILTRNATSRSIGKFLSDLLVQFGEKPTVHQRLTLLETKMARFEELIEPSVRATDEHWAVAEQRSQDMDDGDYVTEEEFTQLLSEKGLVS